MALMSSDKQTFELAKEPEKTSSENTPPEKPPEDSDSVSLTETENQTPKSLPYPKWVAFIVGSNFTERFSYYGMKAILTLYFVEKLSFSETSATVLYHVFCSLCYFTPLLGAIISDARLGKFKTIIYFTLVYVAGAFLLSGSALPHVFWGLTGTKIVTCVSLILIAVGSGCIKPCLAAFGGDQFGPGQENQLDRFFSAFYVSISCGSLISMFLTPFLRTEHCLGQRNCYPLAFGIPSLTIFLGLILIAVGKRWYIIHPPGNNVILNVVCCMGYALKKRFTFAKDQEKKTSWLDYADDKYDKQLIEDVKCLLRVFVLYIPLPLFFSLFDQQGSRWTLQATKLNGRITDQLYVQPDHMQLLNPLIIVIGVPLFDYAIYPVCAKVNFLVKPLQRMVVGGLLAALAFFFACILQMSIDSSQPPFVSKNSGTVMLLSAAPCNVQVISELANANMSSDILLTLKDIPHDVQQTLEVHPIDCRKRISKTGVNFQVSKGEISSVTIVSIAGMLDFYRLNDTYDRSPNGKASVRLIFQIPGKKLLHNATFTFSHQAVGTGNSIIVQSTDLQDGNIGSTDYALLYPGIYKLYIGDPSYDSNDKGNTFNFLPGGRYIILLAPSSEGTLKATKITVTKPNELSVFLQIPQYILITFAEIMFAITGIQFSYSQAPVTMKSLVQAGWLMLIAFGNVIMVIVSKTSALKLAMESLAFAGAMAVDMVIFSFMAYHYRYTDHELLVKGQLEASNTSLVVGNDEKTTNETPPPKA